MEINKEKIVKKIEEVIKSKKLKMRPRWYFVLKTILIMSFSLILFLITIYLTDFVFFIFHEHQKFVPSMAFTDFLKTIPVIILLLIILFLFSLYHLVSEYSFVYRKNILYVILILLMSIILIIVNLNIFIDKDFKVARFGEKGEVPFLQNVHKYYIGDKYKNLKKDLFLEKHSQKKGADY
ncbi:MAG: hypothetical protein U0469_02435 [Candidatus Paceibacterota bacterium]|jgi:uncharacterized protein YacL